MKRWYVLILLLLAYVSSFIDRTIISFFVAPIKDHFGVTDTEIGLLQGTAFAIFYVTFGLFVGRLADRYSRRNLVAVGLVFWSMATAACGLATGFLTLFVCRMLVGVGESTLTPSATSLLADLFPKDKLARAMSVYAAGPYIGQGLAMMIGGWLLGSFGADGAIAIPILGQFSVWQASFLLVGLPGLVLALFFTTFREPMRHEATNALATNEVPPLRDFVNFVSANRTVYAMIFVGLAMLSLVGYGVTSWLPTYYLRTFSAHPSQVGNLLGISLVIGGPCGVLVGGWIGDWLRATRADAAILLGLIGAAGTLLAASLVVLANSLTVSISLVIPLYFFKVIALGPIYACMQLITPNRMRAQIFALFLFVDATIGLGFGPLAIGLFTDHVLGNEQKLGLSILIIVAAAMLIAFGCFWSIRKTVAKMIGSTPEAQLQASAQGICGPTSPSPRCIDSDAQ